MLDRATRHAAPLAALALAAALLAGCQSNSTTATPEGGAATALAAGDPWTTPDLLQPAALAKQLADSTAAKPMLIHVGFHRLYTQGAIPGSIYAGPGSADEGLASLKAAVANVPKDRAIVIYCGCCPWDHCPNMRPAFATLHALGYTNVKALAIGHNLEADWANAGYPLATPRE